MTTGTRVLLWVVLGALALAASMGIGAVLLGRSLDEKLLGSLLVVGMFSLTALGECVVLSFAGSRGLRRGWTLAMRVGLGLSVGGFAIYEGMIWGRPRYDSALWRVIGIWTVWAWAVPVVGLLALTRFTGPREVVRKAVLTLLGLNAGWLSLIFLLDAGESSWQATFILAILSVLGIVGLPILQRLYGAEPPTTSETTRLELKVECPRCLRSDVIPAGRSACAGCGLKFELKVEEPRCKGCGYLLYKLANPRCPECGLATDTARASRVLP